jgi:hypothetical protein
VKAGHPALSPAGHVQADPVGSVLRRRGPPGRCPAVLEHAGAGPCRAVPGQFSQSGPGPPPPPGTSGDGHRDVMPRPGAPILPGVLDAAGRGPAPVPLRFGLQVLPEANNGLSGSARLQAVRSCRTVEHLA